MALQQSITDKSGVVTTYWIISSIHADMINHNVSVTLAGWLTEATYAAGQQQSARRPYFFSIPFASIPSAASGSIALTEVYDALLTIVNNPQKPSPFAGATLVD